ncbi:MAG: hypothetical protein WBN40_09230 [Pseudomonadales bacterium]
MPLNKIILVLSIALMAAGCSKSGGGTTADVGGGGSDSGGSGGISTSTGGAGPIVLNEDNIRGSIEDVAQRVNMIASEIMRALKPYLYNRAPEDNSANATAFGDTPDAFDPLDRVLPYTFTSTGSAGPLNVDQFFADSNTNPNPLDPFLLDGCQVEADANDNLSGIYAVEFRDIDFSDSLTQGDQMVFSYNVEGCDLSAATNYERAPSTVAGIMTVTFAAGSDVTSVDPLPRRMVGTATFQDYEYQNGVLAWRAGDSETITSGSVDFDITLAPVLTNVGAFDALADVSDMRLTNGSFILQSGSALLGGPLVFTFDEIRRQVFAAGGGGGGAALGDYSLTLDNVEVESQTDGASIGFSTVPYPDPAGASSLAGFFDNYPHEGAIEITGGDNSKGLIPAQPDSSRLTVAQVDGDGDDIFELFRPTSWDFLVGQFLVPGSEFFTLTDD